MTRVRANVLAYGFSRLSSDYVLEAFECELEIAGPRHVRPENCSNSEPRVLERDVRRLLEGVSRRFLAGFDEFFVARVGTTNPGARKERYAELRRIELAEPVDLSVLTLFNIGLDVEAVMPERPLDAEPDEYTAAALAALLSGEPAIVYVPPEVLDRPEFHVSVARYAPSYAFKYVSIDTRARIEGRAYVKVVPGKLSTRADSLYAELITLVGEPENLRDFVDEKLYASGVNKDSLRVASDAASVLYIALREDPAYALELAKKPGVARGLGILSKVADERELPIIARLVALTGQELEALGASGGDRKLLSELANVANELIARGSLEEAARIVRAIMKYDAELGLGILIDFPDRSIAKRILISELPGIRVDSLNEGGLLALLYLADKLRLSDKTLSDLSGAVVRRVLRLYEEEERLKKTARKIGARPALPILIMAMMSVLPPPKGLEPAEIETIRSILESFRDVLGYARYEARKVFESYVKRSLIPTLIPLRSDEVDEELRTLLKRLAGEDFRRIIPVPRLERVKAFYPEAYEDFENIVKNIEALRGEISDYLKREPEGPGEGEGDEEM